MTNGQQNGEAAASQQKQHHDPQAPGVGPSAASKVNSNSSNISVVIPPKKPLMMGQYQHHGGIAPATAPMIVSNSSSSNVSGSTLANVPALSSSSSSSTSYGRSFKSSRKQTPKKKRDLTVYDIVAISVLKVFGYDGQLFHGSFTDLCNIVSRVCQHFGLLDGFTNDLVETYINVLLGLGLFELEEDSDSENQKNDGGDEDEENAAKRRRTGPASKKTDAAMEEDDLEPAEPEEDEKEKSEKPPVLSSSSSSSLSAATTSEKRRKFVSNPEMDLVFLQSFDPDYYEKVGKVVIDYINDTVIPKREGDERLRVVVSKPQDQVLGNMENYLTQIYKQTELKEKLAEEEMHALLELVEERENIINEERGVKKTASIAQSLFQGLYDKNEPLQKSSSTSSSSRSRKKKYTPPYDDHKADVVIPIDAPTTMVLPSSVTVMSKSLEKVLNEKASNSRSSSTTVLAANSSSLGASGINYSSEAKDHDPELAQRLLNTRKMLFKIKKSVQSEGEIALERFQARDRRSKSPMGMDQVTYFSTKTSALKNVKQIAPASFYDQTPDTIINSHIHTQPLLFSDIVEQFKLSGQDDSRSGNIITPVSRSRSSRSISVDSSNVSPVGGPPSMGSATALATTPMSAPADPNQPKKEVDLPTWREHDWRTDEDKPFKASETEVEDFSDEAYLKRHNAALAAAKSKWEAQVQEKKRKKEEERERRQMLQQLRNARSPKVSRRGSSGDLSTISATDMPVPGVNIPAVDQPKPVKTPKTRSTQQQLVNEDGGMRTRKSAQKSGDGGRSALGSPRSTGTGQSLKRKRSTSPVPTRRITRNSVEGGGAVIVAPPEMPGSNNSSNTTTSSSGRMTTRHSSGGAEDRKALPSSSSSTTSSNDNRRRVSPRSAGSQQHRVEIDLTKVTNPRSLAAYKAWETRREGIMAREKARKQRADRSSSPANRSERSSGSEDKEMSAISRSRSSRRRSAKESSKPPPEGTRKSPRGAVASTSTRSTRRSPTSRKEDNMEEVEEQQQQQEKRQDEDENEKAGENENEKGMKADDENDLELEEPDGDEDDQKQKQT